MDKIVSKGMETAKAVKATATGISGVFKTLMEQHGEVSGLLRRVQNNPDKRAELWPQIRRELLTHERGELRAVYPVLREFEETRELADLHDADATELEAQIDNLEAEGLDSASWGEQFDILVKLVTEHVREEESDIFPVAMKVCGDDLARELDAKFLEAKKAAIAGIV
jgi:hemerythrin superfamily protein